MTNKSRLVEEELINNYEKYYRLVYSYTKNEADALDAVQEGAYKSVKNAGKIKEEKYISTWIYRIMINEALAIIRNKKRTVSLPEYSDEGKNDKYKDLDLYDAIEKLDTTDQTIIKLRYFEELSLQDIADILELNLSTIKSKLYRALEKLRSDMEEK